MIKLILLALLLNGCAIIASMGGASTTIVSTFETLDYAKGAADVIVYTETKKTLTDHAISKVLGKDCRLFNVFSDKKVCVAEIKKINMPDLSSKEKIIAFQILKGITPATGTIGPKTRLALWKIEHDIDN
jgi:hypothetical protein